MHLILPTPQTPVNMKPSPSGSTREVSVSQYLQCTPKRQAYSSLCSVPVGQCQSLSTVAKSADNKLQSEVIDDKNLPQAPNEDVGKPETLQGVTSEKNKIDTEGSDIIDVVSVRDTHAYLNSCSKSSHLGYRQPQDQMASFKYLNHSQSAQPRLVSESSGRLLQPPMNFKPASNESTLPITSQSESLDLSTRTKDSSEKLDVLPLHQTAAATSNANVHLVAPNSSSQASVSEDESSRKFLPNLETLKPNELMKTDSQVTESMKPSSNLPPHILAWLFSSRLNPMAHRVQVSNSIDTSIFMI